MRARDISRNGKTKTGSALILIARIVEPQERLEYFFAHCGGNPRPIVIDRDRELNVIAMSGDRDGFGVTRGI